MSLSKNRFLGGGAYEPATLTISDGGGDGGGDGGDGGGGGDDGESCDRCTGAGRHGGGGGSSDSSDDSSSVPDTTPDGGSSAPATAAGGRGLLPGTSQPTDPITDDSGDVTAVEPGAARVVAGDVVSDASVTVQEGNISVVRSDVIFSILPQRSASTLVPPSVPQMTVRSQNVFTSQNLQPESLVDLWLASTPTFVGSATVGADGRVSTTFTVPNSIEPGDHTLQINATGADGRLISVNLGVRVVAAPVTLPQTGSDSALLPLALILLFGGMFFAMLLCGDQRRRTPANR
jgi:hypothetical protein